MPKITKLFIRSGMVFFLLAMALAVFIELSRSGMVSMSMSLSGLTPVFWHFLLVGWITQIIMGVSVWMFPRKRRRKKSGAESKIPARVAFYCINAGLILRGITEPLNSGKAFAGFGMVLSAVLQVVGGIFYVTVIWPRVRGVRKRKREGE